MPSPQFFVIKQIVNYQIYSQLCSVWLETASLVGRDSLLVTEEAVISTQDTFNRQYLNHKLNQEKFNLLITPHFCALLWVHQAILPEYCQINITFEQDTVSLYLNWLRQQSQYNSLAIDEIQQIIDRGIIPGCKNLNLFINKIINLLTLNSEHEKYNISNSTATSSVEKFLQEKIKQQNIFNQIKIQIDRHLDLREIIQTAIQQSCSLLQVDRLVIYQFEDLPSKKNNPHDSNFLIDTVTYEATATQEIPSILNFRNEICLRQQYRCRNKYDRGLGLVIDDIEGDFNAQPCLKSLMRQLQIRAKLIAPISIQGKLWGLAGAHQCFTPRRWHHQEIEFLHQLSAHLATAIDQYQSYQELQQQKQVLEQKVETQAQQIKEALISAQAANQSKHEFIGSMSHELRTPLTCVIGLSGTLLNWYQSNKTLPISLEKQQQYLKLIQDSGRQLLSLINNILEFSEVESGKYFLQIGQISLNDFAKITLKMHQEIAQQKNIALSLESELQRGQDIFFADSDRLQEILLNLIDNALKFTPHHGEVILRIWRTSRQVVFQVEDTGIGIAKSEIPLLFEKFKQLEDFRHRTQGGAGLGLALTKQLVELHGGTIEVESTLGVGSTFTVYLPEHKAIQSGIEPEKDQEELLTQPQIVMLITSDDKNAIFYCQLLTATGYKVVWTIDLITALSQVEVLNPDLIIIDRDYFDEDSEEISLITSNQYLINSLKIILLCHQFTQADWISFSQYGIEDYLLKSMNPIKITEKIKAIMNIKIDNSQPLNQALSFENKARVD